MCVKLNSCYIKFLIKKVLRYFFETRVKKMATEAELEIVSCVRGFHVYRFLWNPVLGEELICRREIQRYKFL